MPAQPNVLFIMCDQQRFDTIAALGNPHVYTPNFDRLVRRGLSFTRAYSTCPVCVPARYTIRTGCEPLRTGYYLNGASQLRGDRDRPVNQRCGGPYLAAAMRQRGYRTFGVGKFHTSPWDEQLGYDVHLHSEEIYRTPDQRRRDDFAAFIAREHPAFDFIETLMGERTEMYYVPQMSPLPAEINVEAWAADRTIEQLRRDDDRPFFGFLSFVGPHPPCAPPIPYNRMYNPDRMPNPVVADRALDHMDEQIPWMNHLIWADDINDAWARQLKARYYGEISYIDHCLGRVLDAVEARADAEDTLICFFSDHGDHLGDHHAWQKESFFESSCHVPFLLSWPRRLPADVRRDELVTLTDLFAVATHAAGAVETRDGIDLLGVLEGHATPRDHIIGLYGEPGTPLFKIMVRAEDFKYIYLANGGHEQLFNLAADPHETRQILDTHPEAARRLRTLAIAALRNEFGQAALDHDRLQRFPFESRPLTRIHQFDRSRGVAGFPENPGDVFTVYPPQRSYQP